MQFLLTDENYDVLAQLAIHPNVKVPYIRATDQDNNVYKFTNKGEVFRNGKLLS